MTEQPYQLLPPLSDEEYAALMADIEAHGVRVPVDVDERGQILDGHHRKQIADELGIPCPTRVVIGLTDEEKRHHAVAVNAHRRMLTREQRRALVAAELERDPSRSDRAIGRICGVDHKTVGAIRRGGWGIPRPVPSVDRDTAEGMTVQICRRLSQLNVDVLVMLLSGRPPAEIVGLITGMYVAFEREHGAEMEIVNAVRRSLYLPLIEDVLAWPAGPFAEECLREPDELRSAYLAHVGGGA